MLKRAGICLLIVVYLSAMRAQTSGQLIEQSLDAKLPFTVTRYSSKQGLAQSQVLSIVPTKSGNLLISTYNGVSEFNGVTFKPLTSDNLRATVIYKLMVHEPSGKLFGEQLNGPFYQLAPDSRLIKDCMATCIEQDSLFSIDKSGTIYAAHVQHTVFKKIIETDLPVINCLAIEKNSFLIGTGYGIYRYNRQAKTIVKLIDGEAVDFKVNPYSGIMYAYCAQDIYKIEGNKITTVLGLKPLKHVLCNAIEFKDSEALFAATTQGLYYTDGKHTTLYDKKGALPTHFLQTLYYNTAENCLFVGTGDKGLLKLQFKNCFSFSSKQGFNGNPSLSSIIKTRSGDILTALIKGNIYKIDGDTVYPYGRFDDQLYASLAEINDTIYAGTWGGGIILMANKQLAGNISTPKNLATGFVNAALLDSEKNIWLGGDGISKGTTSQNTAPWLKDKIKSSIIVLYELKNKSICAGGSDGVIILDKNGKLIKQIGKEDGLQGRQVRSFYEDSAGKLWIGTYGGGMYCYDRGRLTSINQMKNAKLNEDVFCMAEDSFGYFYITSNHGLWRVKQKDLDDFYKGKLDYLVPFYYCMETGILNEEFNGGFQNNYLETQNRFYFPSIEGFVRVTPEQPVFKKTTPRLSRVLVNDTASSLENHVFGRNTHSVQFDFESTTLLNKYNVYYQYKLQKDENGEWGTLQKNTYVSFKMLPPGRYTFYLRALDAFNDKQPAEVTFRFEISPYFYETSLFRISAVIIFLALTLLTVIIWVKRYRGKAEEKERVKRELAELELRAVQAQMNPHFIFNSLNSIKHYLHINDTKSADSFIDNFSILLRDFMEYSSEDFITLKKEAYMLGSYLALENMRMNPPFHYTVTLPGALDNLKVPTLLFQAFVENAIKHGITHLSKPGTIAIEFRREENFIFCVITDNGIGRKRSAEINRNRPYHTSKGISIVNEKIRVMKGTYSLHIEMVIEDILDEQNNAAGTSVTLKIPVKND